MSFVIEMVGIPGAGKTTVREELTRHLGDIATPAPHIDREARPRRDILRREVSSRLDSLLAMAYYSRALVIATLVMLRGGRPLGQQLQALRFLIVTFARYRRSRRNMTPGVVVLDEGIVQRCFMVFVEASGARSAALERYLTRCPVPDAVVVVDTDPAVALNRILDRPRGLPPRMAGLSPDQASRVLGEGAALLDEASAFFGGNGLTGVFHINGDEPQGLDQLAQMLTDTARSKRPRA